MAVINLWTRVPRFDSRVQMMIVPLLLAVCVSASRLAAETFKMIIIGPSGVGKTSLASRLYLGHRYKWSAEVPSTVGSAFFVHKFKMDFANTRVNCNLQIWDTAGQERYSSLLPMYLRDSDIVLLVFDVAADLSSFEKARELVMAHPEYLGEEWQAKEAGKRNKLFMVGNKVDLAVSETTRAVDRQVAANFASAHGFDGYFEISVKDGTNFDALVNAVEGSCFDIMMNRRTRAPAPAEKIVVKAEAEQGYCCF